MNTYTTLTARLRLAELVCVQVSRYEMRKTDGTSQMICPVCSYAQAGRTWVTGVNQIWRPTDYKEHTDDCPLAAWRDAIRKAKP